MSPVLTSLLGAGLHINLGKSEGLLLAALFVMGAWAVVDAARHPDAEWKAAGEDKGSWVLYIVLGSMFCGPIGLVVDIYYLAVISPRLRDAGRLKPPPPGGLDDF
jgi:hypothetical protein